MKITCVSKSEGKGFDLDAKLGAGVAIDGAANEGFIREPLFAEFNSKPYKVYCGDALETIQRLKAGGAQFDCVITSPPYFNQRVYGQSSREIEREKDIGSFVRSLVTIFKEIPLRPWASVWVNIGNKWGTNRKLLNIPSRFVIAMEEAGFFLLDEVIWAKEVVRVDGTSIGHCMVEPTNGRLNGDVHDRYKSRGNGGSP